MQTGGLYSCMPNLSLISHTIYQSQLTMLTHCFLTVIVRSCQSWYQLSNEHLESMTLLAYNLAAVSLNLIDCLPSVQSSRYTSLQFPSSTQSPSASSTHPSSSSSANTTTTREIFSCCCSRQTLIDYKSSCRVWAPKTLSTRIINWYKQLTFLYQTWLSWLNWQLSQHCSTFNQGPRLFCIFSAVRVTILLEHTVDKNIPKSLPWKDPYSWVSF